MLFTTRRRKKMRFFLEKLSRVYTFQSPRLLQPPSTTLHLLTLSRFLKVLCTSIYLMWLGGKQVLFSMSLLCTLQQKKTHLKNKWLTLSWRRSLLYRNHPLICSANQRTGFYRDLHDERVLDANFKAGCYAWKKIRHYKVL